MAQEPQSLKNHIRFDPLFHGFLAPVSIFLLIASGVNLVRHLDWASLLQFAAAAWAFIATFKIRLYALKVQDRVIRLEERLRLQHLLPAPQQSRIGELTEDQLLGLRFASDAELPELTEKALAAKWRRKQIKEAVRNWRADYWRV